MAIRIDEYGHIIRDETSTSVNITNSTQNTGPDQLYVPDNASSLEYLSGVQAVSRSSTSILETSTPWYGSGGVFWTITLILSIGVALFMSMAVAPLIFKTSGGSSDFIKSITDFLYNIAPYAVFIGTFVGSIWYNIEVAKSSGKNYHDAHEYILSSLCAIAGAVGTGLLVFLLAIATHIIAAILVIVVIIAVIAGIVSGG